MRTRNNILPAALAAALLIPAGAYAATLEVGSGKPYTTIQSAISAASTGDTILVYDGTYHEEITLNRSLTVKSVNSAGSTIIDSTGFSSFTSGVSFSSGLGRETVLDKFAVAHGVSFRGGNISCYNASPTISNCFIYGGFSVYGPAISCTDGAAPLITNCVISGNLCAYGGGIYCNSSASPTVMNCTISQNRTDNDGSITDANGAGIFCDAASATVTNTIIWGNTANGVSNTIGIKSGGLVSVSYSDIEGGWTGTGNINSDPQFVMPGY
jgi:nitrous oxidase accessory protein NosD